MRGPADQCGAMETNTSPSAVPVVAWPDWSGSNPYQRLFYDALEPHGFTWLRDVGLTFGQVRAACPEPGILHLHWPYAFWRSRGAAATRQWRALVRFALGLRWERARGTTVVWTVHDLEHLGGDRAVDGSGRKIVYEAADLVIHHTEWSRRELHRRWGPPRRTDIVMPHGSYVGALPEPADPNTTRRSLGLAGRRLLLCFGRLDAYKGFDLVPEVARILDGQVHFVVTGPAGSLGRTLGTGNPHLTVLEGRRSDQELADLLRACDGVVLPYRTITSSGALVLALSAGRGVIASDLPPFRELLSRSEAAVLVPPTVDDLVAGVHRYFEREPEDRGSAARALADRWNWADVVRPVARELVSVRATRRASSA